MMMIVDCGDYVYNDVDDNDDDDDDVDDNVQVCAAFTNSSVFRLKKTWERIGKTVIT